MKYCVHFIFKDNKVLLLRRTLTNPFYPGIWTPVVGKIKPNEKPNLAVIRETQEETSIELDNSQFLKHCTFDNDEYWFYRSKTKSSVISLNPRMTTSIFLKKIICPTTYGLFSKPSLTNYGYLVSFLIIKGK